MSVFKRLWSGTERGGSKSKVEVVDEISEFQPYNPFTELLFLEQHNDIVRLLLRIDPKRCVSAADDNLAVVWDIQFGYKLVTLSGHTRPITCMLNLCSKGDNPKQLVTGSSDKQIRIWDVDTGDCLNVLTQHESSVKCLLLFGVNGSFCSGGEVVCLWSKKGQLLASYLPEETESDISKMITIRNERIVASMDKYLAVYTIQQVKGEDANISLVKKLPPHREPVRCLINIADDIFASASLDGTVKLWKTDSLLSYRYFNSVNEEYQGPEKTFPYSVETMLCLANRYIVASVGSGFTLYDTETGQTLLRKEHAHLSKINDLTFTCDGLYLATAAVDGSIRLWSFIDVIRDSIQGNSKSGSLSDGMLEKWYTADSHNLKMSLVGECLAHSGSVQNENVQMMKRNHVLQTLMKCAGIV
ncbi:WD repeat-containing protein 41-like isoform X2 [Mercenaria mercenaria]|uniref:WD repeat-containing protein 41-like isoform X2 n=1 Tax=Mercenaria mercenaria TaxID=6596 RepID=UPI00234F5537|nr:WD repeat-containing protein 41-like isoform X2 [Mercenaria mercenaria]